MKTNQTRTVVDVYPEFAKVLDYVMKNERLIKQRLFANALDKYFQQPYLTDPFEYILKTDPTMESIKFIFNYPMKLRKLTNRLCEHGHHRLIKEVLPMRPKSERRQWCLCLATRNTLRSFLAVQRLIGKGKYSNYSIV